MPDRTGAALAMALALAGCASRQAASNGPAAHDAAAPEEVRLRTLTMFPFWEIPEDANGFGTPIPLDGVEVCVKSKRAYGQKWKDFVETQGPCTSAKAAQNVVLHDAPGLSELLVTAHKDGYRPSVFAATTWQWDLDMTLGNTDGMYNSLRRADASGARIDPAVVVSPERGDLTFWDGGLGWFDSSDRVTLEPYAGDGPYYFLGGKWVAAADSTPLGDASSITGYAGASFVNLPEGEYALRVDTPNSFCHVHGTLGTNGDPFYGFDRPGGLIGAPVLDGYSTPAIRAQCSCLGPDDGGAWCSPLVDAGSPPRGDGAASRP